MYANPITNYKIYNKKAQKMLSLFNKKCQDSYDYLKKYHSKCFMHKIIKYCKKIISGSFQMAVSRVLRMAVFRDWLHFQGIKN